MSPSLRERLSTGKPLIGTLISLGAPEVAEIMAEAGFDWLFVDFEHGAFSLSDAQKLLQAAGPEIPCLVRVPSNERTWISKCLDIGAAGIIVPLVRTAEEAKQAVRFSRYPPEGSRSVGIGRAHRYGMNFEQYMHRANREIAVVIQIEHAEAVENIAAITAVPGIDALFVGPYDLSGSFGKPGKVTDPEVGDAIDKVTRQARQAGLPLGIFGADADAVRPYLEQGYTLICAGTDTLLLGNEARMIRSSLPAS